MAGAIPHLYLNWFALLCSEITTSSEKLLLGTHGLHGILVHGVTEQSKAGEAKVLKNFVRCFAKANN